MRCLATGYFLFWVCFIVHGQQLFVQKYPREAYRGSDQNWAFGQDKRGMIYVGNNDGVLQYNGSTWNLIQLPDQNYVLSIAVDSQDKLFVGSNNELGYLQRDYRGNYTYHSLTALLPAPDRGVKMVIQTLIYKDTVFFNNIGKIYRYANGRFTVFTTKHGRLLRLRDQLYVVEDDGLYVYKNGDFEPSPLNQALQGIKIGRIKDFVGNTYLLLDDSKKLWIFDPGAPAGNRFRSFLSRPDEYFGDFPILDMAWLDNGSVMLLSEKGVFFFGEDGHPASFISNQMLGADILWYRYYKDIHHNLWLATDSYIFQILTSSPLSYYDKGNGLQGDVISLGAFGAFHYVGTGNGIFYQENASSFSRLPGTEGEAWNFYNFHGKCYVAHRTGVFELAGKTVRKLIDQQFVHCLCACKSYPDRLLMGTFDDGLWLLEKKGNTWQKKKIRGFEGEVRQLQEDTAGDIWVSHSRKEISRIRLNPQMDSVLSVEVYDDKKGLPSGNFNRLQQLKDGQILATTIDGIYGYDPKEDRFTPDVRFRKALGKGTYISTITEDEAGNIYFRSGSEQSNGMAGILNKQPDGHFCLFQTPFNKMAIPISGLDFDDEPLLVLGPHEVWMGANDKLISYDPSQKTFYDEPLHLFIDQVRVKDSLIFTGGALTGGLAAGIPYDYNTLKFSFTSTDFENPEKIEYQSRLDGFDNQWSAWAPGKEVDFTNLPEGKYTFRVRARNLYGKVSDTESFSFHIRPPMYRTWWAYLLYMAGFLLLLYAMIRLNAKRMWKKNLELERKVAEKTKEIASQANALQESNAMKDKLFSIVSHDLRGPFGMIQSTVRMMKKTDLSGQEAGPFIMALSDHLAVTGHLLNNLLFWAKAQMDGTRSMSSAFDVAKVAEENGQLFKPLADTKGILLINNVNACLWVYADKDIVTTVLRNLVNNAVKFTKMGGEVIIGARVDKDYAELFVQDTGTGLTSDDISRIANKESFHRADTSGEQGAGLGLMLCQELIAKEGGKIMIKSRPGEGSRFSFRVPIFRETE